MRHPFALTAVIFALAACARGDGAPEPQPGANDGIADIGEGLPEAGDDVANTSWAVAAAHPLATDAGARVLAEGGTAVDAAVAVQAVLSLVEPQSSGLGGGAFMLFFDASTGEITAYDGRETAPLSAKRDMFLKPGGQPMGFMEAVTGGRSVGVPGVVAMLGVAHERHGKLAWNTLFTEAEAHADKGFTVTPRLEGLIARLPSLKSDPVAAKVFFDANGSPLKSGDRLTNPDYAETVRRLAAEGPSSFYTGSIAGAIEARVDDRTGADTMAPDDFAAYEPVLREPVCARVLTYDVCSMGPPSSGGVTLLQILSLYEAATIRGVDPQLAYIEASRLAYADRDAYLADPSYMAIGDTDGAGVVTGLLSSDYLKRRGDLIGDVPAPTAEAGEPVAMSSPPRDNAGYELPSTSHFSVRDGFGNVVSMTTSVEFAFGSQLMAGGMMLNNQLTDFTRDPDMTATPGANDPAPGKRPRSSMTPVIVLEDNKPIIAIGSPGGPAIIGYVAKTLVERMFEGQNIQAAVEAPHIVTARGAVAVETEEQAEALGLLGYQATVRELTSGLYGFEVTEDSLEPAIDPRREGTFASGRLP